jgi:hypothetical protein
MTTFPVVQRPLLGTSLIAKYNLRETAPKFWSLDLFIFDPENVTPRSRGEQNILLEDGVGYIQVVTLDKGIGWVVQFLYRDLNPDYKGLGKKMMQAAFRFLIERSVANVTDKVEISADGFYCRARPSARTIDQFSIERMSKTSKATFVHCSTGIQEEMEHGTCVNVHHGRVKGLILIG